MLVNNQMVSIQPQTSFKGSLSKSVVDRIYAMERKAISSEVCRANYCGQKVSAEVVAQIKEKTREIIKSLQEKAAILFKDSVVALKEDTGEIFVKNKNLHVISGLIDGRESSFFESEASIFAKKITQESQKSSAIRALYDFGIYPEDAAERLQKGVPNNIYELEGLVEIFNPRFLNGFMLQKEKKCMLESLRINGTSSITASLKREVKKVFDLERQLPSGSRKSGFWSEVKALISKNAERKNLEAENAKFLTK